MDASADPVRPRPRRRLLLCVAFCYRRDSKRRDAYLAYLKGEAAVLAQSSAADPAKPEDVKVSLAGIGEVDSTEDLLAVSAAPP